MKPSSLSKPNRLDRSILLVAVLGAAAVWPQPSPAMERKPAFTFRVHQEVSANSGDKFTLPVTPTSAPDQKAFLARVPVITERDIKVAVPFKAADGSYGAALKLSPHGRLALDVASSESRGKLFFLFTSGRQLTDVYVDNRVTDGIFIIPRGLTDAEAELLSREYPAPGTGKKAKRKKKQPVEDASSMSTIPLTR